MTESDVVDLCKSSGALLNGHFQLRSGLHSDQFFQAALLLQYPDKAEAICRHIAAKFASCNVETVVSPAIGGLIVGQEIARALGCRAIFADKENGELLFKRGFSIRRGERVLVAEDVVTRGGRVQQTIDLIHEYDGEVVGVAAIVDRSGGAAHFDVPFCSALKLLLPSYEPEECPCCKRGMPLERPGSK